MRGARHAKWAAAAAAVALAATACGGGGSSGSSGEGVLSAWWGDPQNPLEPANTTEVQGGKVLDMVTRGLKRYNPRTGAAEDMVAEKIETTDAQNFTVKLKDWKFSNGEKVTAESFVNAWNYAAHLKNKQKGAYFFGYIEGYDKVHPEQGNATAETLSGLKVVDEKTFTVKLKQKFSTWPETLGYAAFAPLPKAFFDDRDAWLSKPVGNGPYTVDNYAKGSVMNLKKWEEYPGADKAKNNGVDLKVYTENGVAYNDLVAGNLDLLDDVPAAQLQNVKNDVNGRYASPPAGIIQTLAFPFYKPEWKTEGAVKVRKGLSMAINRKQITETIFHNTRTPATDWTSPVLKTEGGYKAGLCGASCDYNAAEAKKLITEGGGIPGGQLKITYNADSSHKEWVDAVCNSINNALGNNTACVGNPVGTFADYRNKVSKQEMDGPFRAGWQMDYPLIQNFLEPLYYTDASSNDGKWSNKDFDKLMNQANGEVDTAKAVETYQKAEQVVADEMAAIPLWYQNGSVAYSERVSDVALNPFSIPVYSEIKVN
ncbi:ABC transporter substrate-binding protein [Streptomyces sp. NBC_00237]|uniref:peptide ABC transporter substrate-binding protein n=1 Tax=Streptomyces sp. NBC_00237 TaxID=2975687 RepID=UPI002251A6B0|nr:ABC transporter substrate-binding protein [Streptomyces sp. NBC_00237]MCX5204434.1 ABC transporter substrate-binding protein [Streptomyces sp. NBC_00237]